MINNINTIAQNIIKDIWAYGEDKEMRVDSRTILFIA